MYLSLLCSRPSVVFGGLEWFEWLNGLGLWSLCAHPTIVSREVWPKAEENRNALLSGDLDALLNSVENKRFDEPTARFYAAEV